MARFTTVAPSAPAPSAGTHVARIVKARESVSEAGNTMLSMVARFPNQAELPFIVTFAPSDKSARLVTFFLRSLDLVLPTEQGVEVEIRPEDVRDRLFYCRVELDEAGAPKIAKFLSKDEAFAMNPALAHVAVTTQQPRTIGAVAREGLL